MENVMSIITLPRSAVKEINDEYIKVEIPIKESKISYSQISEILNTKGILSDKKAKEWLKELKKDRDNWDRI